MGLFSSLFASQNDKQVKRLSKIADKVEALEEVFAVKSDDELRACTELFKERYKNGESLDSILPEAFACVREASKRVLGMKHFHVQIMGGIALHEGRIAEMYTGEGKTLVATLPAYLNALTGKGVHIVTVNEYLAARDAEWMGRVYKFLGLTVGIIHAEQSEGDKKRAYNADITYGTNSEFGFDYLRDNMSIDPNKVVQRDLVYALVDEVDSILIDEARTPLIISGFSSNEAEDYLRSAQFAKTLIPHDPENTEDEENGDFIIDEETNGITLTTSGVKKAEKFFKVDSIEQDLDVYRHVRYAIKAEFMMKKDKDYIILDGEVVIVDEFTGRIMTGRRYNGGLHQAIEAKEGVAIRNESKTYASITFQNFFRLYTKLSGMTGTAKTEEEEFQEIYNLDVICIPTNKPIQRIDEKDRIYVTAQGKTEGILEEINKCYESGQPVLVGTLSVEKSEALSDLLKEKGIPHTVLNAKEHKKEAEIVSQAGKYKKVTISTNMAGRGTDIMLGGNAEFEAKQKLATLGYSDEEISSVHDSSQANSEIRRKYDELLEQSRKECAIDREKVIEVGGLCIIGTEKHENRRIDNQLRGRAGRQGDVGRSIFFTSAEDDLLRINATEGFDTYIKLKDFPTDKPIEDKYVYSRLEDAQKYVESRNFRARKTVLSYDDVINSQRMVVYADRKKILASESVHDKILSYIPDVVAEIVQDLVDYRYDYRFWNYEEMNEKLESKILPKGTKALTMSLSAEMNIDAVIDGILEQVLRCYEEKRNAINSLGGNQEDNKGAICFDDIEKRILLTTLDKKWQEHIEALEDLNTCIGLRAIGHYDPITSFQIEGMKMFDDFIWDLKKTVVLICLKFEVKPIEG